MPGVKRIEFVRAEKFIKSYRAKERYEVNLTRQAKKPASCKPVAPVEPRLVFAIRIHALVFDFAFIDMCRVL